MKVSPFELKREKPRPPKYTNKQRSRPENTEVERWHPGWSWNSSEGLVISSCLGTHPSCGAGKCYWGEGKWDTPLSWLPPPPNLRLAEENRWMDVLSLRFDPFVVCCQLDIVPATLCVYNEAAFSVSALTHHVSVMEHRLKSGQTCWRSSRWRIL